MSRFVTRPAAVLCLSVLAWIAGPESAEARPNVKRRGGQWDVLLGATACIPGRAECEHGDTGDLVGRTRMSFGAGASLGYRLRKWVFLGASYDFGLLRPDFDYDGDAFPADIAYQHGVFGEFRPILPVWRIDLGLGIAPGFSRLVFKTPGGDKQYSQGFAFKLAPTVDIFVAPRIFLGAKLDLMFNAHTKTCTQVGDTTECVETGDNDLAPVHQFLFGLHLGGTFL